MAIHKLTDRKIKSAGPGAHGDGGCLRLEVSGKGAKKWIFQPTIRGTGRRPEIGLGSYPDVGLAEARRLAMEGRKLAKAGKDLRTVLRAEPDEQTPTFTTCAARHIRAQRRAWKNKKHARQWVSTLKKYARPAIGSMPVDEIGTQDILKILTPIWTTKTETADRVRGRIENVLDYAAARGHRDALNPARWRGHLDKLLPKPSKIKKVIHQPAMPFDQVGDFMAELAANDSVSAKALRFLVLTIPRTNEVLKAEWTEVDLGKAIWTIPESRMKMAIEHRVPLSGAAKAILDALPRIDGNPYIFPGTRRGQPLSNMALLELMRGMGYGKDGKQGHAVPHGFRSSFRDWASEVSSFPPHVAEMALAHAIENTVEAAYRRGDLFKKRREVMESWATYIDPTKAESNVVSGDFRKAGSK